MTPCTVKRTGYDKALPYPRLYHIHNFFHGLKNLPGITLAAWIIYERI